MKIGILGTGPIGSTLVKKLSAAGHVVKVANSRGPETIDPTLLESGAYAVTSAEAISDVDVVIISTPLGILPRLASLFASVPAETVIIDTSNYHPFRDERIDAIEAGQVESLWVVDHIGRPIVKAWNSLIADSLLNKGKPAGDANRIALPVAGDQEQAKAIGMRLVEETGFDAVDAGTLAESWRQQPGAPTYCTDLSREDLPAALAAAEKGRLAKRRDLVTSIFLERYPDLGKEVPPPDFILQLHRLLFM